MGAEVIVGAVGKPFGVHGDVYVHPDPDVAHDFPEGTTFEAGGQTLTVVESRLHAGRRLVRFAEADDRGAAEALRGTVLTLPRDAIELEEGAVWLDDVLGFDVVDEEGALIGVLENVLDSPAHDLLVVARPDGGELLVPAVDDVIEVGDDRIVVHRSAGLLDPDEAEE